MGNYRIGLIAGICTAFALLFLWFGGMLSSSFAAWVNENFAQHHRMLEWSIRAGVVVLILGFVQCVYFVITNFKNLQSRTLSQYAVGFLSPLTLFYVALIWTFSLGLWSEGKLSPTELLIGSVIAASIAGVTVSSIITAHRK